jgi:hypothetical protein
LEIQRARPAGRRRPAGFVVLISSSASASCALLYGSSPPAAGSAGPIARGGLLSLGGGQLINGTLGPGDDLVLQLAGGCTLSFRATPHKADPAFTQAAFSAAPAAPPRFVPAVYAALPLWSMGVPPTLTPAFTTNWALLSAPAARLRAALHRCRGPGH